MSPTDQPAAWSWVWAPSTACRGNPQQVLCRPAKSVTAVVDVVSDGATRAGNTGHFIAHRHRTHQFQAIGHIAGRRNRHDPFTEIVSFLYEFKVVKEFGNHAGQFVIDGINLDCL